MMPPTATALLGFAVWTLLLLTLIGGFRAVVTLSGKKAANSFDPGGADVSPFSQRLCRAHANCYENLPVAGAVMLVALVLGRNGVTDPLAMWFLGARVAQSVVHLVSTSVPAVFLRFGFFLVQIVILAWWAGRLLAA